MPKYLLGTDNGCTVSKAALFTTDGKELAVASRRTETLTPEIGWFERDVDELWRARRSVSPSLARKSPNKLGEDITVPRSAIPEAVRRIKSISKRHGLPVVVFGHAGDGNLHPNVLFDRRNTGHMAKVETMVGDIFRMDLELGGT